MKLFRFSDGFCCYSHSTREETELLYSEIFILRDYIKDAFVMREGDCIFDVGANIGLFTIRLRSLFKNVETYNCALGAAAAKKDISFFPHQAGNSTMRPRSKLKQRILLTLFFGKKKVDTWFEKVRVSVDVEGDEHEVLRGIRRDHVGRIQRLAIEVHGGRRNRLAVSKLLGGMGYATWREKTISSPAGNVIINATKEGIPPESRANA